jgi:sugar (pentulose or hexulose) kinase
VAFALAPNEVTFFMRVLGLDVGTSSVKAAVLDASTAQLVGPLARAPYALDLSTPDAAEVPADRLWGAVAAAAREATRHIDGVEGVGLACLTPALVLLDAADRPVRPIYTHLDRRSRPAARQVWAAVGAEFLNTTGNRPLPGGITAISYRQTLNEDPYLHHSIRSYLHVNGWLALRLTGERAFDPGNASFTGLYGTMTDRSWSPRWCSYFEVELSWLPPVVCGTTTIGSLRSAAAAELGVPAGLPVKLGTADTSSAMLAGGMVPGDLLHIVGTTQAVAALVDRPQPDPQRLVRQLGVGDAYIHATHNPIGGAALGWLRELCFCEQSEQEFYEHTVPDALDRRTIVTLDPPYLGGDRLEIEAHRAAFRNLTLAADRLDLLAALLQEMRRQHRKALAALGAGENFRRIFLTGGGTEIVRRLIPEYATASLSVLEEGSLQGIARLFLPG